MPRVCIDDAWMDYYSKMWKIKQNKDDPSVYSNVYEVVLGLELNIIIHKNIHGCYKWAKHV